MKEESSTVAYIKPATAFHMLSSTSLSNMRNCQYLNFLLLLFCVPHKIVFPVVSIIVIECARGCLRLLANSVNNRILVGTSLA